MRKILLLLTSTTSLMSSLVFANIKLPNPYTLLPPYNCTKEQQLVKNMPRIRSQDSTDSCLGFASWALLQHRICDTYKKDCANLSPDEEVSPFSTLSFAYENSLNAQKEFENGLDVENFRSLHIHPNFKRESYVGLTTIMRNIAQYSNFNLVAESCYPFDQIANTLNLSNFNVIDKALDKMYHVFKNLKKDTEGNVICDDCNKEFEKITDLQKLNLKFDFTGTLLGIRNFEQFFYYTMFGNKCENSHLKKPSFRVRAFPENNTKEDISVEDYIKTIERQINAGNPVGITNFCVDREKINGTCKLYHASVISGVKVECNCPNNQCPCNQNCRTMLRLHNSLGKSWQDNTNNGGWVDANILLSNLDSRKIYGTLTWTE